MCCFPYIYSFDTDHISCYNGNHLFCIHAITWNCQLCNYNQSLLTVNQEQGFFPLFWAREYLLTQANTIFQHKYQTSLTNLRFDNILSNCGKEELTTLREIPLASQNLSTISVTRGIYYTTRCLL